MRNSPKESNFISPPSVLGWVEKYERTRGEHICLCVCASVSLYAYIMNENVLGGLGTSNRTELGATFVFVFCFFYFWTNFFIF
jgi:hypothetical protein